MKKIQVIAHRGASGYAPENTLASFKKALEYGVNYIELDVHLSKDNEVIVIHDSTINRTTNGKGKVREMMLYELKKLDAGSWYHADFAGEKLPLLSDVLSLVNGKCKILIEIKRGDKLYPGIEKKILETIQSYHAETWCEVQSFDDAILNNWLAINHTIPVHKLLVRQQSFFYFDDGLKFGNVINKWKGKVSGINPKGKYASQEFIDSIHKAGMKIYVWTINEEKEIKELVEKGVDGIINNYPDKVKKFYEVQF